MCVVCFDVQLLLKEQQKNNKNPSSTILSSDIIDMKNECAIFPVEQIISTSIGAMCTALLMVE